MNATHETAIVVTGDGSTTLLDPATGETHHSRHGARREAEHVFLHGSGAAARAAAGTPTRVLEIGFGAGLNFAVTAAAFATAGTALDYVGVDAAPPAAAALAALGWDEALDEPAATALPAVLGAGGPKRTWQHGPVRLTLHVASSEAFRAPAASAEVVYLDAFSPGRTPGPWSEPVLRMLHAALVTDGVLATYCAQGAFRRRLRACGFAVESRPGPPGKREMTVAART